MNLMNLDTSFEREVIFQAQRLKDVGRELSSSERKIVQYEKDIVQCGERVALAKKSQQIYKSAVDEVYRRSLGEVEEVVNMALQYVFFDKNYSVSIEIGDVRSKTIDILFYDNDTDPPIVMDSKTGVGNGIRTVESFVLLTYYLISTNIYPFIFADEAYSGVSEAYVDRYFSFVDSLCKKKGLKFGLITHDQRFLIYGNNQYSVSDGNVVHKKLDKAVEKQ